MQRPVADKQPVFVRTALRHGRSALDLAVEVAAAANAVLAVTSFFGLLGLGALAHAAEKLVGPRLATPEGLV